MMSCTSRIVLSRTENVDRDTCSYVEVLRVKFRVHFDEGFVLKAAPERCGVRVSVVAAGETHHANFGLRKYDDVYF